MKRLMYLCSALALFATFGIAGRSYAAHTAAKTTAVRLCASMPLGVPTLHAQSFGVFNAERLATSQWKKRFSKVHLKLLSPLTMDDAKSDGSSYDTDREHSNALTCAGAKNTYGYDGALNSGASLVSEPVLNRAGVVQISPSNSGTILTDPAHRAAQEPATASGKIKTVTYFRTVTTDALQGPADAVYIDKTLKAKTYYLLDDKLTYGAGLAAAMDAYARGKLHMSRVGSGHIDSTDAASEASSSDAITDDIVSKRPAAVFCGCDSETTISLLDDLNRKGYKNPIVAGDAWVTQDIIDKAGIRAMKNAHATAFGPGPKASKKFVAAYKKQFKIALSTYDATSYDATNIMLNAIYQLAKSGHFKGSLFQKRVAVATKVAHMKWHGSIGTTSFDKNGDTKNRIIAVYAVKNDRWVVQGITPPVAGIKPTG